MHPLWFRALAVGVAISLLFSGCSQFIVRDDDSTGVVAAKGIVRVVGGVGTLGASEVYVRVAQKDEEIARTTDPSESARLSEERATMVRTYWATVLIVVAVAGIVAAALAGSNNGGGGGGCTNKVHTPSGTCSWNGGVSHCQGNVAVCNDGKISPGLQSCHVSCD